MMLWTSQQFNGNISVSHWSSVIFHIILSVYVWINVSHPPRFHIPLNTQLKWTSGSEWHDGFKWVSLSDQAIQSNKSVQHAFMMTKSLFCLLLQKKKKKCYEKIFPGQRRWKMVNGWHDQFSLWLLVLWIYFVFFCWPKSSLPAVPHTFLLTACDDVMFEDKPLFQANVICSFE